MQVCTYPNFRKWSRGAGHFAAATAVAIGAGCAVPPSEEVEPTAAEPKHGGRLVTTQRSEPRTFNPLAADDEGTRNVVYPMHADLLHENPITREIEEVLAESWTVSPDGLTYEMALREGVTFSDGEPFDADDVVFTYEVHLDPDVASAQRSLLSPGGEPLVVEKLAPHRVRFRLAQPAAVGPVLFSSVHILPQHKLRDVWENGDVRAAWDVSVDPTEMAGLGPFVLAEYRPGDRVTLARNPRFWKVAPGGESLPYLDEIVIQITGSSDAEVLRFRAGESDLIAGLSAENFDLLSRDPALQDIQLFDAGPDYGRELMVWNLHDLSDRDLPEIEARQNWYGRVELRRAVSKAVDREEIARLVYQGKAAPMASCESPANTKWLNQSIAVETRDLDEARNLLRQGGFDWDAEGRLVDENGDRVTFTLLTSSTNEHRQRITVMLAQDLLELGIEARVVPMDQGSLIDRVFSTKNFDAIFLNIGGDSDPNSASNMYTTDGGSLLWGGTDPPREWQREIDDLMNAQRVETDPAKRKALWDRVQEILHEQQPLLELVAPHNLAAAKASVGGVQPAPLPPTTLWNAEWIYSLRAGQMQLP